VPFDQVCEGQENRVNYLQGGWVYTSSIAGQEIKGTVEFIVTPLSDSQNGNIVFSIVP
jgi:hypothetical protein